MGLTKYIVEPSSRTGSCIAFNSLRTGNHGHTIPVLGVKQCEIYRMYLGEKTNPTDYRSAIKMTAIFLQRESVENFK